MEVTRLGKLVGPNTRRDAVHVAVMPVEAGHALEPGDRVTVSEQGKAYLAPDDGIGVVDPFLKDTVLTGDWFYLCIEPDTVTSLRHTWTHPKLKARLPL